MTPRVVVVGLGPAGPDLTTDAARAHLRGDRPLFLRTERHPAAEAWIDGATTFDDAYETAASFDDVYRSIVDALVDAATEHDDIVYAVPGSPVVAEQSVDLLRADGRVEVELVAALSFLDLAWVRLGIDPIAAAVSLIDGRRFVTDAGGRSGAALIAQCDNGDVLSDIKLAVDDGPVVTVLHHLGLPDEQITEVAWADLDRAFAPDHLTSLYLPSLGSPPGATVVRFDELVHLLRRECPWDREQTHESLRPYVLEEAQEVAEALDALDVDGAMGEDGFDELRDELGDLLFQVVIHATLAEEEGRFTLDDVATSIHDKLVHRHPHVFGDAVAETSDDVIEIWHAQKAKEAES